MTVENAGFCEYCRRHDHVEDDCPQARSDHRFERIFGYFTLVLLAPFALAGVLVGWAWGAFRAGLDWSKEGWTGTLAYLRALGKKRPPNDA